MHVMMHMEVKHICSLKQSFLWQLVICVFYHYITYVLSVYLTLTFFSGGKSES